MCVCTDDVAQTVSRNTHLVESLLEVWDALSSGRADKVDPEDEGHEGDVRPLHLHHFPGTLQESVCLVGGQHLLPVQAAHAGGGHQAERPVPSLHGTEIHSQRAGGQEEGGRGLYVPACCGG